MAKLDTSEIDVINDFLDQFGQSWENVRKAGLWEGRRILKDGLIKAIDELPSVPDHYYNAVLLPLSGIRETEKKGLRDGVRIMKMERTNDGVSVSVSFAGYNENGKPNLMIRRSIVKGSTVVKPNKFVRRRFNENEQKRVRACLDKIYSIKLRKG